MTATAGPPIPADPAPAARARGAPVPSGARAVLPYAVSLVPFGLVVGAAADRSPVDDLLGWSTAWLVYGGSAQIALTRMLDAGAAPAAVVVTVALVNLRLLAYAAVLAPVWRTADRRWTALACYLVLDPVYVVVTDPRLSPGGPAHGADVGWHRRFHLGAGALTWVAWVAACGAGTLLGPAVGTLLPVGTVVDLMLGAMVAMLVRDRGTAAAAAAGLAIGLPAAALPAGAGPVLAGLAVVAPALVGPVCRRLRPERPPHPRSL
jgi:branched chain amino acid efflux pump